MTLVENGASNNRVESGDVDQSKSSIPISGFHQQKKMIPNGNGVLNHHHHQMKVNGVDHHDHEEEGFKKEMRDLAEMLSKLNPMAEEFVPPSLSNNNYNAPLLLPPSATAHFGYSVVNDFLLQTNQTPFPNINGVSPRRKGNFTHGKRRMNNRTNLAQREDVIRRTVHVSDIDQQVTEEQLAALFINCGQVVDCRICGDPNSVLRFAFIEFTNEEGARNALSLAGTMLGYYPVRVLPSKTAIAPVNPTFFATWLFLQRLRLGHVHLALICTEKSG